MLIFHQFYYYRMFISLIVVFQIFALNSAEINALSCRSQWSKVRDCTKSRRDEYSSDPTINLNQVDSFLKDLTACYTNQACNNPFASLPQRNVRRNCAKDIVQRINRKISSCVRRQFSDFDLPDYDEVGYLLNQYKSDLKNADRDGNLCPPQADRSRIDQCVRDTVSGTLNRQRNNFQSSTYCRTLQTCLSDNVGRGAVDGGGDLANVGSDCWQRWQDANVQTCRCATDPSSGLTSLTLETYRQEYRQCLESHNGVYDDISDIFGQWLMFYAENNFCGPNSNACGLMNGGGDGNFFLGGGGASVGRRNGFGFRNFRTTTIFPPPDGGDGDGAGFLGGGGPIDQSPPPGAFGGVTDTAGNRGFFGGGNGGDQSSFNGGGGSPVGPGSSVGPPNILGNLFGRGNIDLSNLFGNWGKK